MRVTDEFLVLSEAISIRWEAIKSLKVLEDKLLVIMDDEVTVELAGLDPKSVDSAFSTYSRYLTTKTPPSPTTDPGSK